MNTWLPWLPPAPGPAPILTTDHLKAAVIWLCLFALFTIGLKLLLGRASIGDIAGTALAIQLGVSTIQRVMRGHSAFVLCKRMWWLLMRQSVLTGSACGACGVLLVLFAPPSSPDGMLLSTLGIALLINTVLTPAATIILLSRMRVNHRAQTPLDGAGGQLEA